MLVMHKKREQPNLFTNHAGKLREDRIKTFKIFLGFDEHGSE